MADQFVVAAVTKTRKFRREHNFRGTGGKARRPQQVTVENLDNFEKGLTWKARRGYFWLINTIQLFEHMNPGYLAHYLQIPQERSEEARLSWLEWGRKAENYELPPMSLWPWDSLISWQNQPETQELLQRLREEVPSERESYVAAGIA